MDKFIKAEAFKRKLIDEKNFYPAIVARALEEMPAADVVERSSFEQVSQKYLKFQQKHLNGELVEVVRCEKCKYRTTHTCAITGIKTLFCDYGNKPVVVEPTHYCGYGERRYNS